MSLENIREEIDLIDNQIVKLFKQRMDCAYRVAVEKKKDGKGVLNPMREREILNRVANMSGDELQGYAKILFSTLFDLSRSYQTQYLSDNFKLADKIKKALENTAQMFPKNAIVACQGIEGAYSQIACDKLFSLPSIMYFENFDGVFSAVEKGLCQYGILPIENSSYGSVNAVYDLMKKYSFHIVRSTKLRINHALLTKKNADVSRIREIFSHEQAIGQSGDFLKKFPGVKITVCENTAVAAKAVAESDRDDVAAISSEDCAMIYNLEIAQANIQNSDNNYTRFICISKNLEIYPGADKTSIMMAVSHKPGSLYELIANFSALGVNLTKLESRPIPGTDFEFMFYFDMDSSVYDDAVLKLLSEFSESNDRFVYLGSYREV